ncbi:YdeI/OmpD-associated family protein [Flavitalea sp. BT771]|uniref:YdeI/OmpD-associated family protein n=1 Tax=Flavitalea sp. BT771 TaxID=3063329 RepID=UPI0026E1F0C5|nr:YdeI/OmpD-associated family protein [Flavitalea sp. BT771]MDO6435564.1 YdeI/OmpD-associated family protein [Flavitalea sp. BT771]MDV6224464.1 YdeI/OmpD-associated family protein [Flavitalea sp. BT771]
MTNTKTTTVIDARIDAYIIRSADFARPILEHIRKLVHKAWPGVEETIKWGMPFFQNNGSILCNMAAFKAHCAFGLWNASLLKDPEGILQLKEKNAMGHLDRITSKKDLPSDKIMIAYIREAAELNEKGIKKTKPKAAPKKEPPIPAALTTALKKNKKALAAFEAFSPSHRREYIEWIAEAKTEATREKRIATAMEWLTEGKSLRWKYQKK